MSLSGADREALELLAGLLEYPTVDLAARAARARDLFTGEAAQELGTFAGWAASVPLGQAEEQFIRTFDLAPNASLDAGWHLFGEAYRRGPLLVKLRLAERAHGVSEGSELPDHIPVLLRLVARLDDDEDPRGLCDEIVLPALDKIDAALIAGGSPYRALLRALAVYLGGGRAHPPARLPVLHPETVP